MEVIIKSSKIALLWSHFLANNTVFPNFGTFSTPDFSFFPSLITMRLYIRMKLLNKIFHFMMSAQF